MTRRGEKAQPARDRHAGVLRAAAELELVDVPGLIVRIKATGFYADDALLTAVFGRWLPS
jgi:hypothetical protein